MHRERYQIARVLRSISRKQLIGFTAIRTELDQTLVRSPAEDLPEPEDRCGRDRGAEAFRPRSHRSPDIKLHLASAERGSPCRDRVPEFEVICCYLRPPMQASSELGLSRFE